VSATAHSLVFQFPLLDRKPVPPRPTLVPPPPAVEPGERDEVKQLRATLDRAIAAKVLSATELLGALARQRRTEVLPTTLEPFDALLGGGLPRGKMVELAGRRGAGRFSVVLATLASATSAGEAAVLIDLGDHLDPQLAAANGVDLRRMLWIRPQTMKDAVHAVEMIAATGFQLVVLDAGLHPIRGRRAPDAAWVRLARTAEAQGTAMLVSTPYPMTGTASEAVVRATRTRAKWIGGGASPRVLAGMSIDYALEKHRHLRPGRTAQLQLITMEAAAGGCAMEEVAEPAPAPMRKVAAR
jgi:hypothetical protein